MTGRTCAACGGPLLRRPAESEKRFAVRKTCGCKSKTRGEKSGEKTPWLSRYGGGYLSAAQWLAEVMCDRRAKREGRSLPHRFWDSPSEAPFFFEQLSHANRLLKRFQMVAVLEALETADGKTVYSLGSSRFAGMVSRRAESPPAQEVPLPAPESPPLSYVPPPLIFSPNLLSRLRDGPQEK